MALAPLTAKANTGTGTDQLATLDTGSGLAGAAVLVDNTGALITSANGLPTSAADGSISTIGAKADAAYAGSGSASLVAALKGLYVAMVAATPAGSNVIGGVTVADGSDSGMGATTDAAASAGGTGSLSAKLRRLMLQLPAALGQTTMSASQPVTIASDQSVINVVEPDELAVSGTLTALGVLFTQDMKGYESVSVQVTSAGTTCTITYEISDDNSNWLGTSGIDSTQVGNTLPVLNSTTVRALLFAKKARYFRARVSTYTSGTVSVVGNLHKSPTLQSTRVSVDGAINQGATIGSGFQTILAGYTANPGAVSTSQAVRQIGTIIGAGIIKPYSIPEADWKANVSLSTNTSTALQAAGGAGVKNYLTALQFSGNATAVANTIQILDGATVIWGPHTIAAATPLTTLVFPTPLQSSANAALNAQVITAPVGAVEVSAQGYAAAD